MGRPSLDIGTEVSSEDPISWHKIKVTKLGALKSSGSGKQTNVLQTLDTCLKATISTTGYLQALTATPEPELSENSNYQATHQWWVIKVQANNKSI